MNKKLLFLMLLAMLLIACGSNTSDGEPELEPTMLVEATEVAHTPIPEPTDIPLSTATSIPEPVSEGIQELDGVQSAVIRIETQGTFIDPQVGQVSNAAGGGTGFIINEEGIAITNNHVVTGAALLKVYVAGEDEPRNAQILGVSECSDLAVIDIEGDGFPYLSWYDGDVNTGLDVYTAGFPLGDPEFTLTRGIVSKASAGGESVWASVNQVIEHDATINPGNSGGPLVTQDGQVVGINYAGNASTNQYFAITRSEAEGIIAQLQEGNDVTSIGINGTAVNNGEIAGIWVSSVASGSAADKVGIEGGDIILSLQGLYLASDGTMSDYCDVIRSHDRDAVLNVEVLRFSTQEILEGQLNGDPLEATLSFSGQQEEAPPSEEVVGYSGYQAVQDDHELLSVQLPIEWRDINGEAWVVNGEQVGFALRAAPDLAAFGNNRDVPGIFFGASPVLVEAYQTPGAFLDENNLTNECEYIERNSYTSDKFEGEYDVYKNCSSTDSLLVVLAAAPVPGPPSFGIVIRVQIASDADFEALEYIFDSFYVN